MLGRFGKPLGIITVGGLVFGFANCSSGDSPGSVGSECHDPQPKDYVAEGLATMVREQWMLDAGDAISAALTPNEIRYLSGLDFTDANTDALMADPVLQKAIRAVEDVDGPTGCVEFASAPQTPCSDFGIQCSYADEVDEREVFLGAVSQIFPVVAVGLAGAACIAGTAGLATAVCVGIMAYGLKHLLIESAAEMPDEGGYYDEEAAADCISETASDEACLCRYHDDCAGCGSSNQPCCPSTNYDSRSGDCYEGACTTVTSNGGQAAVGVFCR